MFLEVTMDFIIIIIIIIVIIITPESKLGISPVYWLHSVRRAIFLASTVALVSIYYTF